MRTLSGVGFPAINISRQVRLLAAFAAVYVLWGSTYLAIALGLRSIPPLLLMGARSVIGGAILLGAVALSRSEPPRKDAWLAAVAGGLLLFVGCHGTLAYVQQQVPSGIAALVLATIPFWLVMLDFLIPGGERRSPWILAGLVPGLGGVALIARGGHGSGGTQLSPMMALLLLAAALSWAGGTLVSRRLGARTPAALLGGMQLVCGGAVLLILGVLVGELSHLSPRAISAASWFGLAYLAIAGSVVAFTAYIWLLRRVPAPLVGTYTFVNPIIAVILGSALLGERLTILAVSGSALVIGSVIAVWYLDRSGDDSTAESASLRRYLK
jgi:drug/metabolite transporter (DMT)-like permease